MNIERLYEIWDECYNEYGSAWGDYVSEHELEMDIQYWHKTQRLSEEEVYENVLPMLVAARDTVDAHRENMHE